MVFDDIIITQDFLEDWANSPKRVQKRADSKIKLWAITHSLTNSAQQHRADGHDAWIIWLTKGKGSYRIMAQCHEHKLVLLRLLNHEQAEDYLR